MDKNMRTYAAVGAVIVVLAGGVYWLFGGTQGSIASLAGASQSVQIKPTDMVHGNPNAPVEMIEYASMTCPHCANFQKQIIPQLNKEYVDTGKVKVVFREYPLDGAARMASAVARCLSGDQFFSFIDLLFANQMNWIKDFDNNNQLTREDILEGLTQQGRVAGLSREKVQACADDPNNLAQVDANWNEGMSKYNVNSTPTFIINGKSYPGEIPWDQLKAIIDPLVK